MSNSRCGIFVPVEVRFKWTNTLPRENALFLGSLGQRVQLGRAAALYCRVSTADQKLCPPGTGPTRLRQEGWLQNRGGLEGNRLRGKAGARRTQEGPGVGAGPQSRRDPRHRTDPLGAARSLTCFKFRFVSSPPTDQRWPANTPTCRMDAGVLDALPATPR